MEKIGCFTKISDYLNGDCHLPKHQDDKNIIISMSLLMRLFEFMHEEAQDDVAMHNVMEKIISFNDGVNPLTMEDYDLLISDAQTKEEEPTEEIATDEDMTKAHNIGEFMADNDVNLSNIEYSDVGELLKVANGTECGASNGELEQFWKGYEGTDCINGCEITKSPSFNCCVDTQTGSMCDGDKVCSQEELSDELVSEIENIINNCKL